MANAVRLIDYIQAKNGYTTFFSELDSDLKQGDKVFIRGGNFDNTIYTNPDSNSFNPFHSFAGGYEIISIDITNSNAITLNIPFIQIPVYKTEKELLVEPNQLREAYISKSYFKSGEFNGGIFKDGLFGDYNILGDESTRGYERQHSVDLYIEELINSGNTTLASELSQKDYSMLESPSVNNNATFNNNFEKAADFNGGVFLGGEYQWGEWKSKYNRNKTGRKQSRNATGGITDPNDSSRFNVFTFTNNNDSLGYSKIISGNIGRVYKATHNITAIKDTNYLTIDFIPYPLYKAMEYGNFKVLVKFDGYIYTIDYIDNLTIYLTQNLYDINGEYQIELFMDDSQRKNSITNAEIMHPDIFNSIFTDVNILGGDFHYGKVLDGKVSSEYSRNYWHNGISENMEARDLRWEDGIWNNGIWKGDGNVSIKSFRIEQGTLTLTIDAKYKHLFEIGMDVFVSYFKKVLGKEYFANFTDTTGKIINFQSFNLYNIVENNTTCELILLGEVNSISDVNLQYAKVSQSYFESGIWYNGEWQSGLRKTSEYNVIDFTFNQGTNSLSITLDNNIFRPGDKIEISNLYANLQITITDLIEDITQDDRVINYQKPFDEILTVDRIQNNTVYVLFDGIVIESDLQLEVELTGFTKILTGNDKTIVTKSLWRNGKFQSGAFRGGIWNDGEFKSKLYFDSSDILNHAVFQKGYWRNGILENSTFLSGVWENGTVNSGVVTNLFDNNETNSATSWDNGDTIFNNGIINDVEWRRGVMKNTTINGGKIINGAIENVDFKSGEYSDGLDVFSDIYNRNRSGRENTHDKLSAPSMIYIDGDGWVQLDQPSYYQKDYNVIFKDLESFENPFNNQMFNILERDKFASKIKVDYSNGDNPIYLLDEFNSKKPILSIDQISGFAQLEENKYWISDSIHNRVLELNGNKVDVIGKIFGVTTPGAYDFDSIQTVVASANPLFVYLLVTKNNFNYVRALSKDKSSYFDILLTLDNEDILDIKISEYNTSLNSEIIFVLTDKRILYAKGSWGIFKELTTTSSKLFNIISTDNTLDCFIYDTNIIHSIFDFSSSTQTYQLRNTSTIEYTFGSITSFDCKYDENIIKMWLNINSNVYLFEYNKPFNNSDNTLTLLNQVALEYPIKDIKLSFDKNYLVLTGYKNNKLLYLSKSTLNQQLSGFDDLLSPYKLLDIQNDIEKLDYSYWYFDRNTSRLIHIDESVENYTQEDVDYTSSIEKMTYGTSINKIFSIQNTNGVYSIRKSEYGSVGNSTTYNFSNIGKIHDVVYADNLFILVENTNQYMVITQVNLLDSNTQDITTLPFYKNNSTIGLAGNDYIFDIVKDNNIYLGLVYSGGNVSEIIMDSSNIISSRVIYSNIGIVSDIVIKKDDTEKYSAYFTTLTGIIKVVSDKKLTTGYRWSEFESSIYTSNNLTTLNKNSNNTKLLVKKSDNYSVMNASYISEDYILEEATINGYGLSKSRLVNVSSTTGLTIKGEYNQNARIDTPLITDLLLSNPKSLTYIENFTSHDYLFFIDGNYIRYYNISNGTYSILQQTGIPRYGNYKDLCYDSDNNRLYFLDGTTIYYINSAFTITLSTTVSGVFDRFSTKQVSGTMNFVLLGDDNRIDVASTVSPNITIYGTSWSIATDLITDVAFIDNRIYMVNNSKVEYFQYETTSWNTNSIRVEGFNNTKHIFETTTGLGVLDNSIYIIFTDTINESRIRISDFTFTDSMLFLYNQGTSGINGVIRTNNYSNLNLDSSQVLDDISTGIFIKLENVSDTIAYVLFDESGTNSLYKYNFATNIVNLVSNPSVGYRNNQEQYPSLTGYSTEIVDISYAEGNLMVLFNIVGTDKYDVMFYNNTYEPIYYVYSSTTNDVGYDAIDINGDYTSERLDASTFGGVRYLFESEISPKIDFNYGKSFFYYGTTGNANILKIEIVDDIEILSNSEYNDLLLKVTISGFDNLSAATVELYPLSLTGTIITTPLTIGSETVTLDSNQIFVNFENVSEFIAQQYKLVVKSDFPNYGTSGVAIDYFETFLGDECSSRTRILTDNQFTIQPGLNVVYKFHELVRVAIGKWEIRGHYGYNNSSSYDVINTINSPVDYIESYKYDLFDSIMDNGQFDIVFDTLTPLDNIYDLENITKGYSVDNGLSPYVTARVLYRTIIEDNALFNKSGNTYTAHMVSSRWKNGDFVGSWDTPFFIDNKVKEDYSVFIDGTFRGNFHDGFFLGGDFRDATLYQGHFSSDNNSIAFDSTIDNNNRFDILNAWYDDSLYMEVQGVYLDGDDYKTKIITEISKGSIVKIPALFKDNSYKITEIIKNGYKVNNLDEITLVIEKPLLTDLEILDLFREELFISSKEYSEYLFGFFKPVHVFINNDYVYITINNKFNSFNEYGKFIPENTIINYNEYFKITSSVVNDTTTIFTIDLPIPSSADSNEFINRFYLKMNLEMKNDFINIPDYLQMFVTTFNKSNYDVNVNTDTLKNTYLSNIDNNSQVSVENEIRDIMVDKSYVTSKLAEISNSIFVSGRTDADWKSGAWLNHDDKGFSNGESSFTGKFRGDYVKIRDFYFEGNDFIWIELDSILPGTDKYRYITLRGFSGDKSVLIGATRSNVYRVIEVDNNFIKIRNPFKHYNFNGDKLVLQHQIIRAKSQYGIDVRLGEIQKKQFTDYNFDLGFIYNTVSVNGWYQLPTGNRYNWTLSGSRLVADNGSSGSRTSNKIRTKFPFLKDIEYTITFDIYSSGSGPVSLPNQSRLTMTIILDADTENEEIITNTYVIPKDSNDTTISNFITFTPTREYSEISFFINPNTYSGCVINSITIDYLFDSNTQYTFDYGYASISAWNGGEFTGEFNSIWNAGKFLDGDFNGEWFGTSENYAYNGMLGVSSENIDGEFIVTVDLDIDFIENGDFLRIEFADIFDGQQLLHNFDGVYSTVVDKKALFVSDKYIGDGNYLLNIVKYRNTSGLVLDYNSNLVNNSSAMDQREIFDYNLNGTSSNYVINFNGETSIPIIDYINLAIKENNQFSLDLHFYVGSGIQPLVAFHNSELEFNGIKLFVEDGDLKIVYINSNYQVIENNLTDVTLNAWQHFVLIYNNGTISIGLNGSVVYSPIINTLDIISKYDICYIGKMINNGVYYLTGKIDEFRIWNKDMSSYFPDFTDYKIVNNYIPELVAYYSFDNTYDSAKYYPEEEQYYNMDVSTGYELLENNTEFVYANKNIFIEMDFFLESGPSAISKILTMQEIRNVSITDASLVLIGYYLELIVVKISETEFSFKIRERLSKKTGTGNYIHEASKDHEYVLDLVNGQYLKWNNLILTDTTLYLNGVKVGNYTLKNRNLFKYTNESTIHIGKYEFAFQAIPPYNIPIIPTDGINGFIKNVNIWEDVKSIDEYFVYRILSGEDTNLFQDNEVLKSGNPQNLIIPQFNNGSINWEHYIYSSETNFERPVITSDFVEGLDLNLNLTDTSKLETAFPDVDWLNKNDFISIDTESLSSSTNINIINSYLLTSHQNGTSAISLTNIENFKFFGKNMAYEGNLSVNITASGYLYFEETFPEQQLLYRYPILKYADIKEDLSYNQTKSTDALMFNMILDVREPNGFVKYADRENEFVVVFYGKATDLDGSYLYQNNTSQLEDKYSYFAIRIDKINSNILFYVRKVDSSTSQKYLGLRRTDGYWNSIKDSNIFSYYKTREVVNSGTTYYLGDPDFVVGKEQNLVNSSNNTEYILFVPRFDVVNRSDDFAQYLTTKDYDKLKEQGLSIYKQFTGLYQSNIDYIEEEVVFGGYTKKYRVDSLDNLIEFNPIDYITPSYTKNEQFNKEGDSLVSRVSVFYNGNFNAGIWHNGVFLNGNILNHNFIWKYGIKHNGRIQGGDSLDTFSRWLGGFHIGTKDFSWMKNVIWERGVFQGGEWEKGQWLSLDYNLDYQKDISIWNKGVWYSRRLTTTQTSTGNIFTFANGGTFSNDTDGLNFSSGLINTNRSTTEYYDDLGDTYSLHINNNQGLFNINFTDKDTIITSDAIAVRRNTQYTITAKLYCRVDTANNAGICLEAIGSSAISNKVLIARKNTETYVIENNSPYYVIADNNSNIWMEIKHTFNTLSNDFINVRFSRFGSFTVNQGGACFIDRIEMIGEIIDDVNIDMYKIYNHDSVWHGGIWNSPNILKEMNGSIPVYHDYSYINPETDTYTVVNSQTLQLPNVNSLFLGGLWLRGDFNGGIMTNAFWHSVTAGRNDATLYEQKVEADYDKTYSTFKQGKMMNSLWYGGTVIENIDKLDVVFGDLLTFNINYINRNNNHDFVWDRDFIFKKSTIPTAYSADILGRTYFTGYHNDELYNGTEERNTLIETNRVKNQYNSDGIMSVYWKRGEFNNGVFQFSHFDSLDLEEVRQSIISVSSSDNKSIFSGIFYSSLWKNGLFLAKATEGAYPLRVEEPNSIFYLSQWERGYWKSVGIEVDMLLSPLDTNNDDTNISNALFSRSLWNSGVFEGGIFDLSVWRSGVTENGVVMKYKGDTTVLSPGDINNQAFYIDGITDNNGTNFSYSTSGIGEVMGYVYNDSTFISMFENSKYRYLGDVDNMASIWVNGTMRGSVWHGGIWQRGFFTHRNFDYSNELNFFGDITSTNHQLGIWNRGIWLSGYFSYYNDRVVKSGANLLINAHLYNDAFKASITDNNVGRRCIFLSINAENLNDNSNIIGMNDSNFNTFVNEVSNNNQSKHNFASMFTRRLLKDSLSNTVYKPYFGIFSGSFINGMVYFEDDYSLYLGRQDKMFFTLFSTISSYYLDTTSTNGSFEEVSGNINGIFTNTIKVSKSSVSDIIVPYDLSPVAYDSLNVRWDSVVTPSNKTFLNVINNGVILKNGVPNLQTHNIWRHNADESTSGEAFGDGTLTYNLPVFPDSSDNAVQVSIAQGCAMKWIPDEAEGEPKYIGSDVEIDFISTTVDYESDDFDGTNFKVL